MVCRSSQIVRLLLTATVAVYLIPSFATAADEDSRMLRIAARAAAESGDFLEAARHLRDASRVAGDQDVERQASRLADRLEGGSGQADFGPLIDLIMTQTTPPAIWSEDAGDGVGGSITPFDQGVFVGGPAALASVMLRFDGSRLEQIAQAVGRANRNANVRQASPLRLVSLPRLEQQVSDLLASGAELPDDIRNLAGISKVEYLFVFPESGDVVIGGPANDWTLDGDGRTISVADGRPVLQLDDLVTLGRTFAVDGPGFFRCSIDPRQEQVRAVNDFVRRNRRSLTPRTAADFTQQLENLLGLQNVIVDGVPASSRVARVIVEADYRMKQIGIGDVKGVPGMQSYFELMSRSERRRGGSMDALRWWMAVGYESIQMAPSGDVFEFSGTSVRCLSEDQIVQADGSRAATGKAKGANANFARLFTEHFPVLSTVDPVFGDLENVFDLAMVAALIHARGLELNARLNTGAFASGGDYQAESAAVPTELMTAATHRVFGGRHVVVQVAGGVRGDMAAVVTDATRFQETDELQTRASGATPFGQSSERWWWDAETP